MVLKVDSLIKPRTSLDAEGELTGLTTSLYGCAPEVEYRQGLRNAGEGPSTTMLGLVHPVWVLGPAGMWETLSHGREHVEQREGTRLRLRTVGSLAIDSLLGVSCGRLEQVETLIASLTTSRAT